MGVDWFKKTLGIKNVTVDCMFWNDAPWRVQNVPDKDQVKYWFEPLFAYSWGILKNDFSSEFKNYIQTEFNLDLKTKTLYNT